MKKLYIILPLVMILCFMFGCQDKAVMVELEELKAQEAQEKQNMELAKRYIEAINQGNYEILMELLSPDYAAYSPPGISGHVSRERLIENYTTAAKQFGSFTWKIEDIIAAGDKVVCRIMVSGIYQGSVPGVKVTGAQVSFSLINIMRIESEKIVEEWMIDDMLGLARQLGMELKPKEEEK